jgi:hypothetical protein
MEESEIVGKLVAYASSKNINLFFFINLYILIITNGYYFNEQINLTHQWKELDYWPVLEFAYWNLTNISVYEVTLSSRPWHMIKLKDSYRSTYTKNDFFLA